MTAIQIPVTFRRGTPKYFPRLSHEIEAQTPHPAEEARRRLRELLLRDPSQEKRISHALVRVIPAERFDAEILAATRHAEGPLDHRFYGVVHASLADQFALEYMIVHDLAGRLLGIQPFFILDQDILAGTTGKFLDLAGKLRTRWPKLLWMRTLMIGNPAGPTTLGTALDATSEKMGMQFAMALAEAFQGYARERRARVIVFKDFEGGTRRDLAAITDTGGGGGANFMRIPSMPMTKMSLRGFASFDDYMQRSLSKVTRKGLRRKFRCTADEDIHLSVTQDVSDCVEEVHRLYLQVYERAQMKFEKLTPEFFLALTRRMASAVRFFLWRRGGPRGPLVAMSTTLLSGTGPDKSLCDLYLGMEYPLALELHLYFMTMRDIVNWAIANRIGTYYSTPLSYDAKLHLRHRLVPLDLYARSASPLLNPPFKAMLHFAQPTRQDKMLSQFANAHELKGPV